MSTKPTLRPLDFQPVIYQEQRLWFLRDPLQLTHYQVLLPPALAQMLAFVDGTRDLHEIHTAFCQMMGQSVEFDVVQDTLAQLDEACLLDNERSQQIKAKQLAQYHAQPHRLPALAGISYPSDPEDLMALFTRYNQDDSTLSSGWQGRAIIGPHIDYERGGPVYARIWQQAAGAIADADLVLIFGTDHNGGPGTITLTRQPYATPFGVLPTNLNLVDSLAQALGPENAFSLELNHRQEHSVELSAVWLHYIYRRLNREPAPMVPILCGSFYHFLNNGHHPAEDATMRTFLQTLRRRTATTRVLAVASVDLAHVGPHFGDPFPIDKERQRRLQRSDKRLIAAIKAGNHDRFYDEIAGVRDRNRICGFSSIYLMLRYLESTQGTEIAYRHCSADDEKTSFVSICGLLLD